MPQDNTWFDKIKSYGNQISNATALGWNSTLARFYAYQERVKMSMADDYQKSMTLKNYNPLTGYDNKYTTALQDPTRTLQNNILINAINDSRNKQYQEKVENFKAELDAETENELMINESNVEDVYALEKAKVIKTYSDMKKNALLEKQQAENEMNEYLSSIDNNVASFVAGLPLGITSYFTDPIRLGSDLAVGSAVALASSTLGAGAVASLGLEFATDAIMDIAFDTLDREIADKENSTLEEKAKIAGQSVVNNLAMKAVFKLAGMAFRKNNADAQSNANQNVTVTDKDIAKAQAQNALDVSSNQVEISTYKNKFKNAYDDKVTNESPAYNQSLDNRLAVETDSQATGRVLHKPKSDEFVYGEDKFSVGKIDNQDSKIINDAVSSQTISENVGDEAKLNIINKTRENIGAKKIESVDEMKSQTVGANPRQDRYTTDAINQTIIKNNEGKLLSSFDEAVEALATTPQAKRATFIEDVDGREYRAEIISNPDGTFLILKRPNQIYPNDEAYSNIVKYSPLENDDIILQKFGTAYVVDKDGNVLKTYSKSSIAKLNQYLTMNRVENKIAHILNDAYEDVSGGVYESRFSRSPILNLSAEDALNIAQTITDDILRNRDSMNMNDIEFLKTLTGERAIINSNGEPVEIFGLENINDGTFDINMLTKAILGEDTGVLGYNLLGEYLRNKTKTEYSLRRNVSFQDTMHDIYNDPSISKQILDKIIKQSDDGEMVLNTDKGALFENGIEETLLDLYINPNKVDARFLDKYGITNRDDLMNILSYIQEQYSLDDLNFYAISKSLGDEFDERLMTDLGFIVNDDMGINNVTSESFLNGVFNIIKQIGNPQSKYDKQKLFNILDRFNDYNVLPQKYIASKDNPMINMPEGIISSTPKNTDASLAINMYDYMLNNRQGQNITSKELSNMIADIPRDLSVSIDRVVNRISSELKDNIDDVQVNKVVNETSTQAINTIELIQKGLSSKDPIKYIKGKNFKSQLEKLRNQYNILSIGNEDVIKISKLEKLSKLTDDEIAEALPEILQDLRTSFDNVSQYKSEIVFPFDKSSQLVDELTGLSNNISNVKASVSDAQIKSNGAVELISSVVDRFTKNKDLKKYITTKKFEGTKLAIIDALEQIKAPDDIIQQLKNYDTTKYTAQDKELLSSLISKSLKYIEQYNQRAGAVLPAFEKMFNEIQDIINHPNASDKFATKKFTDNLNTFIYQLKILDPNNEFISGEVFDTITNISTRYGTKQQAKKFVEKNSELSKAIGLLKKINSTIKEKSNQNTYNYIKDRDVMSYFDDLQNLIKENPQIINEIDELSLYVNMTNYLKNIFDDLRNSQKYSPLKDRKILGDEVSISPLTNAGRVENAMLEKIFRKDITLSDEEMFKKVGTPVGKKTIKVSELGELLKRGEEVEVEGAFERYITDKRKDAFKEIYEDAKQFLTEEVEVDGRIETIVPSLDEFTIWYAKYLNAVDRTRSSFKYVQNKKGLLPLMRVSELFPSKEKFIDFVTTRKGRLNGTIDYHKNGNELINTLISATNLRIAEYKTLGQTTYGLSQKLVTGTKDRYKNHFITRLSGLRPEGHATPELLNQMTNQVGKLLEKFANAHEGALIYGDMDIRPEKFGSGIIRFMYAKILGYRGINEIPNKANYIRSIVNRPDINGKSILGKDGKYSVVYANIQRAKDVGGGFLDLFPHIKDGFLNHCIAVRNIANIAYHFRDLSKVNLKNQSQSYYNKNYRRAKNGAVSSTYANYQARFLADKLRNDGKDISSKWYPKKAMEAFRMGYDEWTKGRMGTQLSGDILQDTISWEVVNDIILNMKRLDYDQLDNPTKFRLKASGVTEDNYPIFKKILNTFEDEDTMLGDIIGGNFNQSVYGFADRIDLSNLRGFVETYHRKLATVNDTSVFKSGNVETMIDTLAMFMRRTTINLGKNDLIRTFAYQTENGVWKPKISAQLQQHSLDEVLKWFGGGIADNLLKLSALALTGGVGLMFSNVVADTTRVIKDISEVVGSVRKISDKMEQDEEFTVKVGNAMSELFGIMTDYSQRNINVLALLSGGQSITELLSDVVEPAVRTFTNIKLNEGYTRQEISEMLYGLKLPYGTEPQEPSVALSALGKAFIFDIVGGGLKNYLLGEYAYPSAYGEEARDIKARKSLRGKDDAGITEATYDIIGAKISEAMESPKGYIGDIINNYKSKDIPKEMEDKLNTLRGIILADYYKEAIMNDAQQMNSSALAVNKFYNDNLLENNDITKQEYEKNMIEVLDSIGTEDAYNALDEYTKQDVDKIIAITVGDASKMKVKQAKAQILSFMSSNPQMDMEQVMEYFVPNIKEIEGFDVQVYKSFDEMPSYLKELYYTEVKDYCTKNEFLVYSNNGKTIDDIITDSENNNKFFTDEPVEDIEQPYNNNDFKLPEVMPINVQAKRQDVANDDIAEIQSENKLVNIDTIVESNQDINNVNGASDIKIEPNRDEVLETESKKFLEDSFAVSVDNKELYDEISEILSDDEKLDISNAIVQTLDEKKEEIKSDSKFEYSFSKLVDESMEIMNNIKFKDLTKEIVSYFIKDDVNKTQSDSVKLPEDTPKEVVNQARYIVNQIQNMPINNEPSVDLNKVDASKSIEKPNEDVKKKSDLDKIAEAKYVTKTGQGVVSNEIVEQLVDINKLPKTVKWIWDEMIKYNPHTGDERVKHYFNSIGWGNLSANENWCAGILSAGFTANGYKLKNRTVNAQQFAQNGDEVSLSKANVGDVLVFRNRNSKGQPIRTGHVNMVIYKDDNYIVAIGGNQSDTNSNERDGLNRINCKLYSIKELEKKQAFKDRSDLSVIRVKSKS